MEGYDALGEDEPGDADRQNRLDTWRPMLGTADNGPLDPPGGPRGPGIIFADVDAAPLDQLSSLDTSDVAPVNPPIRFARQGTDTAAKKGDAKLAYDLSESDPSVYSELLDVDNQFPAAQDWENLHWSPKVTSLPRIPRYPLPIPANAQRIGATTPGEVAALALRRVPRVWFTTLREMNWQDYGIDGRHVVFPRMTYPQGDGPMESQGASMSVTAAIADPITSELGANPPSGGEDYSMMSGANA
jgi:hypothetical protein